MTSAVTEKAETTVDTNFEAAADMEVGIRDFVRHDCRAFGRTHVSIDGERLPSQPMNRVTPKPVWLMSNRSSSVSLARLPRTSKALLPNSKTFVIYCMPKVTACSGRFPAMPSLAKLPRSLRV